MGRDANAFFPARSTSNSLQSRHTEMKLSEEIVQAICSRFVTEDSRAIPFIGMSREPHQLSNQHLALEWFPRRAERKA
jgi:hypothetical protein